jgi:hypothetical protein
MVKCGPGGEGVGQIQPAITERERDIITAIMASKALTKSTYRCSINYFMKMVISITSVKA